MSIRASCAIWESSWRREMLALRPEKNRHRKSDDCSEANPPREFHQRQPAWLFVKLCAEDARDVVRQSAQDGDDDEADDHGDDVAAIIATSFGENAAEEHA